MNELELSELTKVPLPLEGGFHAYIANVERELIVRALEQANGKPYAAAKLLGMNRTTLAERRKKLGLPMRYQLSPYKPQDPIE